MVLARALEGTGMPGSSCEEPAPGFPPQSRYGASSKDLRLRRRIRKDSLEVTSKIWSQTQLCRLSINGGESYRSCAVLHPMSFSFDTGLLFRCYRVSL